MKGILQYLAGQSKWFSSADVLSYSVLLLGVTLLPLIFSPLWGMSVQVTKQFFIPLVVLVALVLYLVAQIEARSFKIPKSYVLAALSLPLLATIFSALASTYRAGSFWGIHFDTGTVVFLAALSILCILSSILISSKERIVNVYLALLVAGIIAGVYQLLVVLLAGILSYFGIGLSWWIVTLPLSVIGRWYESAIFFGFIAGSSLVFLEFLSLEDNRVFKRWLFSALIISLLCLVLVNFYLVWIALALWAVGVFVYATMSGNVTASTAKDRTLRGRLGIFRPSFVVLVISIMFLTLGTSGGVLTKAVSYIYNTLNIPVIEVRPDLSATWVVGKGVLGDNALLGSGPNQFVNAWLLHKPTAVNLSPFWEIDFNAGVGTLPTWWISTGILGLLAWFIFFGTLAYLNFLVCRAVFSTGDRFMQVLSLLTTASLWYFWLFALVYIGEAVLLGLAFIFSGVIVALGVMYKVTDWSEVGPTNQVARVGTLGALIALLLLSLAGIYITLERSWGSVLFYRSIYTVNKVGNVEKAERLLARAVTHNPKADVYYRALSNIQFIRLSQLAQSKEDPEILQAKFRGVLETTIANSGRAILLNPANYANYVSLGQVYESLVPFKVEGAYTRARDEYLKAQKLNPGNPNILFSIARLEMASGNSTGARNFLSQSLEEKPNFTSALLVLAQIEAGEGRLLEAIRRTEEAAAMYPNDPSVFFQLGFYYYQNNDYAKAVEVLRKVVALSPNQVNANAQYFLGFSYDRLGDRANALKQFEQIAIYNPDNQEVKTIIANLRAGGSAVTAPAATSDTGDNETEE